MNGAFYDEIIIGFDVFEDNNFFKFPGSIESVLNPQEP